jgi:hypothetical protein
VNYGGEGSEEKRRTGQRRGDEIMEERTRMKGRSREGEIMMYETESATVQRT